MLEKQIESVKLNPEVLRISTEMALRASLMAIANAEMDIALLESVIELNKENLRIVTLKHERGQASENDLRTAEHSLAQNEKNLAALKISLDNEKKALNNLLQQPLLQKTVIEYEIETGELPEDVEKFIADKIKNDPTLKQKEIEVEIKKLDLDNKQTLLRDREREKARNTDPEKNEQFIDDTNRAKRERDDARRAHEAAIRSLDDAKRSMEVAILSHINTLIQMDNRTTSLLADKENAERLLQTVKTSLNVGMVTQYEVDSAALGIAKIETDIEKNIMPQWLQYFRLEHPFLLNFN